METEIIKKMKKVISTKKSPKAIGPYSQAILSENTLYCSGQIAINPKTGELILSSISEETHQVMKNIKHVLTAANTSLEDVVFVRIYLVNFQDFDKMNTVYESYFASNKLPARTCIGVSGLAVGASVEIDLIAKVV